MSDKMIERMAKIEEKVDGLKEDVGEIKTTLTTFIENADKRYAPIWAADAIKWVIVVIVGGVIVAGLSFLINKK